MRILVVDDDREIVDLLSIYLRKEQFDIVKAYNGKQALEKIEQHGSEIGLVILDIMMPRLDGISVVTEVRKTNQQLPILMLSAKSTDVDKIQGLTSGADDYVTKPFNPLEVVARVKSLLRRATPAEVVVTEEIEIGPLIIKKDSHEVRVVGGGNVQLTVLEFGILYLLASHPNRVFSADEIFETVWQQESIVSTKTVMVHVSHLRDKLGEATGGDKVVETVWGVGYKISGN